MLTPESAPPPEPVSPQELPPDPELPATAGSTPRRLTTREKALLEPFIPAEDLDGAVLHVGDMPLYMALQPDKRAITRGADIYFEDPSWTFRTADQLASLAHELTHVGQYREGMTWASYLWSARNGYMQSQYEIPAFAMYDRVYASLRQRGVA